MNIPIPDFDDELIEDLASIDSRRDEPTESLEDFIKAVEADEPYTS